MVLALLHVSVSPLLFAMLTVGAVVFTVVVAEAEAVQPLLPITVTEKVPALLTVIASVVAPLLHE